MASDCPVSPGSVGADKTSLPGQVDDASSTLPIAPREPIPIGRGRPEPAADQQRPDEGCDESNHIRKVGRRLEKASPRHESRPLSRLVRL